MAETPMLGVKMKPGLRQRLEKEAERIGATASVVARIAIVEHLDKQDRRDKEDGKIS